MSVRTINSLTALNVYTSTSHLAMNVTTTVPLLDLSLQKGRAITQAVSRWLPTAAALVRSQVRSCGICGGQSGTGACFLRVLRFPLPILIQPTAP
jgi:hypothetical protein